MEEAATPISCSIGHLCGDDRWTKGMGQPDYMAHPVWVEARRNWRPGTRGSDELARVWGNRRLHRGNAGARDIRGGESVAVPELEGATPVDLQSDAQFSLLETNPESNRVPYN